MLTYPDENVEGAENVPDARVSRAAHGSNTPRCPQRDERFGSVS